MGEIGKMEVKEMDILLIFVMFGLLYFINLLGLEADMIFAIGFFIVLICISPVLVRIINIIDREYANTHKKETQASAKNPSFHKSIQRGAGASVLRAKQCPRCGAANSNDAFYCRKCGTKI